MLVLYGTRLSANARKAEAVARHLHLPFAYREVNVYAGEGQRSEYRRVHPAGRIPALVDSDADLTLTESNAIALYLAERVADGGLWPASPADRARATSWLFWEAAHWQPALTAMLAPHVGHALRPADVPAPSAPPDWDAPPLRPLLARLEAHLGDRPWLLGEALSVADFAVAGMTTYFRSARFPAARFPAVAAWWARVEALEAWRATAVAPWDDAGS